MKRFISAIICLILVVALVGCGQNNAAQDEGKSGSAAASQLDAIKSAGVLKVGIEGTYKPYTYHDENDNLTGYDVDLAKAIAEKLGVEVAFTEAAWDSLLAGIDSGRLDTVINTVGITSERQEKYDFAGPYLYIPRQVVVRSDNDTLQSWDDLKGAKVATSKASTTGQIYAEAGAEIVLIEGTDQAAQTVLSGRADFCNFDPTTLNDYLDEHPEAQLKVAFMVPGLSEEYGIPILKGQTEFYDAVNQALDDLRSEGVLEELSQKYLRGDYTNPVE
ncbi:transporter substrate-binding domain-containing protein [Oscillibacter sp. 1-3]|uniref:transporter substrate-binding domain-containing protein n=1 Tax=Oscillibacter sp. 1-3 TaxID=1235797 RepID=UPI0003363146|nr:transporter substrate-binding domain-containing protein [Oscillibacter sp. 1-3]EOS64348.1 hypothetical protein C816_03028 [Oscillibacter sp. 1-3]